MTSTVASEAPSEAYAEFNTLIQTLHEQGLLRLANDAVASHPQWTRTLSRIFDNALDEGGWLDMLPALNELAALARTLHEQGLLRLANEVAASHSQWGHTLSRIVDDTLDSEDARKMLQNLSVLAEQLARMEPDQLNCLLQALRNGLEGATKYKSKTSEEVAPGLMGAYRMLSDDALWRGLHPITDVIRALGEGLNQEGNADGARTRPEKPHS